MRLAFAMTINTAPGQSMDHLGADLTTPAFTHGQLYVALSRATHVDNIEVALPPANSGRTANIVFKDLVDIM